MTGDRVPRGPHCPRTRGLIEHIVDEKVTPADRDHAASCAACGPVLMRAAKFDDELRRTARGLVAEELPRGILDPGLSNAPQVEARGAGPGLAGIAAAVAIMILAISFAVPGGIGRPSAAPGGTDQPPAGTGRPVPPTSGPPPSVPAQTPLQVQAPALLPTHLIGGSLIQNEWTCGSGRPLATDGPIPTKVDHEGIVCTSSKRMVLTKSAVITGEDVDDVVVEVAVKGDLVVVTDTAVSEIAETMSKVAFLSVGDSERAPKVADWVLAKVPELKQQPGGDRSIGVFGDLLLTLERASNGDFLLLMQAQFRG